MLRTEDPLAVGEQRLEDRDRVLRATGSLVGAREVAAGEQRVGVLAAEDPLEVGEQRLEDLDRVLRATGVLVGVREVVAGAERVWMVGAELPLVVGEHRLEDRDRVRRATALPGRGRPFVQRSAWSCSRSHFEDQITDDPARPPAGNPTPRTAAARVDRLMIEPARDMPSR